MNNQLTDGIISCMIGLLAAGLVTGSALAADKAIQTAKETVNNPFAGVDQRASMRQSALSNTSTTTLQAHITTPVASVGTPCSDLNSIALDLGHEPVGPCRESQNNLTATEPPANSGSVDEEDAGMPDGTPVAEVVLLIHGFSLHSGHDCNSYWLSQKNAIEDQGRNALIVGFYKNNTNGCDVDVSNDNHYSKFTPIDTIARALRDYINENHPGTYIDIVAHSMGGIVTRRMLQLWGQELLIDNVVTLGTPHGGVKTLHFWGSCALITQCREMSAGSSFMNALTHNPQSIIPTQWTLIGAADDQVVGFGTALEMTNGNTGGPVVSTHHYDLHHKHNCGYLAMTMGHGDLQGHNATLPVHDCDQFGFSQGTLPTPQDKLMQAIGLGD